MSQSLPRRNLFRHLTKPRYRCSVLTGRRLLRCRPRSHPIAIVPYRLAARRPRSSNPARISHGNENATKFACCDDLLGQRHHGNSSIIIPNHRPDPRFSGRFDHLLPSRFRANGLSYKIGGGDRNFGMGIVRTGNVHYIDLRIRDQLFSSRCNVTASPICARTVWSSLDRARPRP